MRRQAYIVVPAAALWLVLAAGEPSSLLIGVPAIAGACWLYLRSAKRPPAAWRLWPALRFAAFFVVGSIRGAIDIAGRTLRPKLAIDPVRFSYPTALESAGERMLLAATVTLMPGTAATAVGDSWIGIHSLVPDPEVVDEIERCEALVSALTGKTQETR